jgi:hypothetical protein
VATLFLYRMYGRMKIEGLAPKMKATLRSGLRQENNARGDQQRRIPHLLALIRPAKTSVLGERHTHGWKERRIGFQNNKADRAPAVREPWLFQTF